MPSRRDFFRETAVTVAPLAGQPSPVHCAPPVPDETGRWSRPLLTRALGVALKPWRSVLPLRREGKSITIRHFDLRQTLGVHDLVFLDDVVLVQQEGGEGVHLIRA